MINPFPIEDPTLDNAIATAFAHLETLSPDADGYQKTVDQISKLYKLQNDRYRGFQDAQEFEAKHDLERDTRAYVETMEQRPFIQRIDPNTALTVAGNILIGLAVIKYEQTGVISSKVFSFMKKM